MPEFRHIALEHLAGMKRKVALAVLCLLLYTGAELVEPWTFKVIFDFVLLGHPLPPWLALLQPLLDHGPGLAILVLSLLIILVALVQGVTTYFRVAATVTIGNEIVYRVRSELYAHVQRLSLRFHSQARSGELLTKVTGDTNTLKEIIGDALLVSVTDALTLLGMTVVMLSLDWQLTMIVIVTMPLVFGCMRFVVARIKVSVAAQRRREGEIASRISETLRSVRLVQAFGRHEHEQAAFDDQSRESLAESVRAARTEAAATRATKLLVAVGKWAVVCAASWKVVQGSMLPGDLLVFWAYMGKMYKPLQDLATTWGKFAKASVSVDRINAVLAEVPDIQDRPGAVPAEELHGLIEFDGVSFSYDGGRDALIDATFTLRPGTRVALVGASGAGKSTIVSLILRLIDPQRGVVRIDGRDVRDYQHLSLRQQIGVVLQDSVLFGATVRENISYGKPHATMAEIEAAARSANAHEFIAQLEQGYESVIGERGDTLSGGQRQRLAMARAFIRSAPILVLDEPMSALDAHNQALIDDALARLTAGRTCLLITHDTLRAASCDWVLLLDQGRIQEAGTPADLLARGGSFHRLHRGREHEVDVVDAALAREQPEPTAIPELVDDASLEAGRGSRP